MIEGRHEDRLLEDRGEKIDRTLGSNGFYLRYHVLYGIAARRRYDIADAEDLVPIDSKQRTLAY